MLADTATITNILQVLTGSFNLSNEAIIQLAALTLREGRPKFAALVREARAPADCSSS